jgi:hypothetical protein
VRIPLGDPGEIGWLAREETGDGVYQHGVGRSGVETAGLFERQDPLHPAIALVTGRAQRALAPQHPKAQGPLRPVIRRLDTVVRQKDPERVHLAEQATGKFPCIVLTIMILVDQLAKPGVPGPPFPPSGRSCGHVAQAL